MFILKQMMIWVKFTSITNKMNMYKPTLAQINDYWNMKIKPMTDLEGTGQVEYWKTPIETYMDLHGDCEDYSMAKYWTLTTSGYDDVYFLTVTLKDNSGNNIPHTVVQVGEWILDNYAKSIVKLSNRVDITEILYKSNHLQDQKLNDPRFNITFGRNEGVVDLITNIINEEIKGYE